MDRVDASVNVLSQDLLRQSSPRARESLTAEPELEALLQKHLAAARQRWSAEWLSGSAFLSAVASRLPDSGDALTALRAMRVEDVYLVGACAAGVEEAMQAFAEQAIPVIRQAARRIARDMNIVDDVQQSVLEKLLLRSPSPGVTRYSGRGRLHSWLRVVAIREAQDHLRRSSRAPDVPDDRLDERLVEADDAELALFKQRYRSEFEAAFRAALASLTARERNILRYRVVDGLEMQAIAQLHRVHRVTMTRWTRRIREHVLRMTRRELSERLKGDPNDVSTIMRLVSSRLDASVSQFLVR